MQHPTRTRITKPIKIILLLLCIGLVILPTGCATLFYSDRVNQPSSQRGDLDWPMALLDVSWIFIAGLPGVIPIVVDLADGAIYQSR